MNRQERILELVYDLREDLDEFEEIEEEIKFELTL